MDYEQNGAKQWTDLIESGSEFDCGWKKPGSRPWAQSSNYIIRRMQILSLTGCQIKLQGKNMYLQVPWWWLANGILKIQKKRSLFWGGWKSTSCQMEGHALWNNTKEKWTRCSNTHNLLQLDQQSSLQGGLLKCLEVPTTKQIRQVWAWTGHI